MKNPLHEYSSRYWEIRRKIHRGEHKAGYWYGIGRAIGKVIFFGILIGVILGAIALLLWFFSLMGIDVIKILGG